MLVGTEERERLCVEQANIFATFHQHGLVTLVELAVHKGDAGGIESVQDSVGKVRRGARKIVARGLI